MTEDEKPKYVLPPLARGGLFAEPNFKPRLADRLGSVRTDNGVSEHWPKDIAPVFYPHVNNPLALGAMVTVAQRPQVSGEKTLVEVPGGEGPSLPSALATPPGNSEPIEPLPGSSVRGKTELGPPEGLLEPEAAVAPTARYGLTQIGGPGEVPQPVVEVIEASGAVEAVAEPVQATEAPTEAPDEPAEWEAPLELEGEGP